MFKFSKLIARWFSRTEEAPSLKPFESFENTLRDARPKPRAAFQHDLKMKLRAHYEVSHEKELVSAFHAFRVPRWAATTMVVVLVVGGGTFVGASPAPMPSTKTFGELEGTEHPDWAPLSIQFDQPMVQDSVEEAFSISPVVEGHFIWKGSKELLFLPNTPLDPTVEYTISVSANAKSLFQKHLAKPYERVFQPVLDVEIPEELEANVSTIQELRDAQGPLTQEEREILKEKFQEIERETNVKPPLPEKPEGWEPREHRPDRPDRPLLEMNGERPAEIPPVFVNTDILPTTAGDVL